MTSVAANIMAWAKARPEGTPIQAAGLRHLGSPSAVRQSLARLERRGLLMRVYRGIYVRRIEPAARLKNLGIGPGMPPEPLIMQGLAKLWGEVIVPTGAAAANLLGRCEQNVVRSVYWTTGPDRNMWWGGRRIELQHQPRWVLASPDTRAGLAMRALVWLCKPFPDTLDSELGLIIAQLSAPDREEFAQLQTVMPAWLAEPVNRYLSQSYKPPNEQQDLHLPTNPA